MRKEVEPASAKVVLKDLPVNFANVDQCATYNYLLNPMVYCVLLLNLVRVPSLCCSIVFLFLYSHLKVW